MSNSQKIPNSYLAKDWFFEERIQAEGSTQIIRGAAFQHLAKSLRKQEGDSVVMLDGKGLLAMTRIHRLMKRELEIEVQQTQQILAKKPELILYVGFTQKPSRNEWMLEKVTELGVSQIQPLSLKRSLPKPLKMDRMQKILQAAATQSHQAYVPQLSPPCPLSELEMERGQILIAHCLEDPRKLPLLDLKLSEEAGPIHILIGPEGDFTEDEVAYITGLGAQPISLGSQRLRTETAAMAAITYLDLWRN